MKKVKSQHKNAGNVNGNKKPPKRMEKLSKKKSKMRKKIFSRTKEGTESLKGKVAQPEVVKSNTVPKEVKRSVTNIKLPKDNVSSNWAAFKESGLHLIQVKPKPKSSSDFKGVFRNKRKVLHSGSSTELNPKETAEIESNTLDCLDIDDTYIKDLVPPDEKSLKALTKCIAIDCEMVGVGDGKESALARVSLVNQHGACVYDKFVKPKEDVADYRTKVSGVRPGDLALGEELEIVQREVAKIVDGRILVGHAISHDLKVLFLSHPPHMVRDTSKFRPFKDLFDGRTPALRKLADKILGVKIQDGEHSSVEDAKATMQLYNLYQKEWEEHRKLRALRKREKILQTKEAKKQGTSQVSPSGHNSSQPAVPDIKFGKHRKINLDKRDKAKSHKSTAAISTMPDEYVAF